MSWVGGDIPGLQHAGTTLKGGPEKLKAVVHDLTGTVDQIVGSASWTGEAAEAMRGHWTRNAVEVAEVGTFINGIGESLGQLGDGLSHLEGALYDSADACQHRGAHIDMSNGKPLPLQGEPSAEATKAQNEYQAAYDYAIQAAKALRMAAAAEISSLVRPIVENPSGSTEADKPTMASILRGIYTGGYEATGARIQGLEDSRKTAAANFEGAAGQLESDMQEFAKNGGPKLPPELLQNAADFDGALAKFQAVDKEVATKIPELQDKTQLPGSKLLNMKIEDIAKALPTGELSAKLKLFNEIPVLDVVASGVMVYNQVQDDVSKGADTSTAIAQDSTAAGTGLLSGTAVGALGSVEAVADVIPGPGWAVGAGLVVAVGVGDAAYQGFHEHWSEDFDQHGVLGGLGEGLGNTFSREGGDLKAMGVEVKNDVVEGWDWTADHTESLWHGIFG
ncbi:MAG: WXG100 family type VII secretion target [Mycobacterium sp.]